MEKVTCTLEIEFTEAGRAFGDSWDFTIGIYEFTKLSDTRVRVVYKYTDEVTRIKEDGTHVTGLTSWSAAYITAEENLQSLLDIITLDRSGVGIRIVPDSLLQSSPHIWDNPNEYIHQVELPNLNRIKEQFNRLLASGDEKLFDALRMNRLASNEDNTGEKIGQLWGAVEVLYASNSPKILNTGEKKKELRDLIDQAQLITSEEKKRLKQMVVNTDAKSISRMVAEKLSLSDGEGNEQSIKDVQDKVSDWRSVRSPQAHGNVLVRDREAHRLAGEMKHLIEQVISAEINPSGYVFFVFQPSQMKAHFYDNNKARLDPGGSGYYSSGIHVYASLNMVDSVRYSLENADSEVYLVNYNSVTRVTLESADSIEISDCHPEAQALIQKRRDFLNHIQN